MQRIVPQSVPASYSHFPSEQLMLPAPRIAGVLPARVGQLPPDAPPFVYSDLRLTEISPEQRDRLYTAARTLLDVAVAHSLDAMNDHALNTALALFRRAVTGQPMRPRNPAQFNAEMDVTLLEWAVRHG